MQEGERKMGRTKEWLLTRFEREGPGAEKERLWLVLGGGGLKGLAHIGAWRAIQEAGIRVEGILGTSIGALVGVALAAGMDQEELEERARSLQPRDIVRTQRRALWVNGIRSPSVFREELLRRYISESIPVKSWAELEIPVQMNAVELGSGATEWFGKGAREDVAPADAVYASAALPVFYPPAEIGGQYFVDGGTGDALALTRARDLGATAILGVDVGSGPTEDAERVVKGGLVAVHQRVFSIQSGTARRAMLEGWKSPPLLFVRPHLDGYRTFDFEHAAYFIEEGYRATRRALEEELTDLDAAGTGRRVGDWPE